MSVYLEKWRYFKSLDPDASFTLSQEEAEMSVFDVFILLGKENELEAE